MLLAFILHRNTLPFPLAPFAIFLSVFGILWFESVGLHLLCLGLPRSMFTQLPGPVAWSLPFLLEVSHYYEMRAEPPLLLLLLLQGPACPVRLCFPLCLLSFSLFAWGLLPHIAHASHGYVCCVICVIHGN